MANEGMTASAATPTLQASQVYLMAVFCLVGGLAAGYGLRSSQGTAPAGRSVTVASQPAARAAAAASSRRLPTLEEMKQMADKQAAPLLEKLKSDPGNSSVLVQVGAIYHTTHQFKEAAAYYGRAVEADPGNVAVRTKLASSLYRSGDADGAIAQLNKALSYDPKDANALFDLGMIRLQGKQDSKGALVAWRQLLKSNPQLSADRREAVQKLMAEVQGATAQNR